MNKRDQMRAWFRREDAARRERVEARSAHVKEKIEERLSLLQKDRDGKPIAHMSSRSWQREGAGGMPRSVIFSRVMAIPKKRK